MIITKYLDLLILLEEVAPTALLEAMEEENILEQEVEIEIVDFTPGRPATRNDPADPPEWDEQPVEDYGLVVLKRLGDNPWTARALPKSGLSGIAGAVNQVVGSLDLADDIWRARQEAAA